MTVNGNYTNELVSRFWSYRHQAFAGQDQLFDRPAPTNLRPPVFLKASETHNLLVDPELDLPARKQILNAIPPRKRHRWFRSMKSSQALVQSVFGTLKTLGMLHILSDVVSEDNSRPFDFGGSEPEAELERSITTLRERNGRVTEVDVYLSRGRRVAVECKLTEQHFTPCSRPRLEPADRGHCDGSYTHQHGRAARCSLTEAGILYWQFIPSLLRWDTDGDVAECPLCDTYQLVRNVLAACVCDGQVDADNGVAVLLYDARNPAFTHGGEGFGAYETVRRAVRNPATVCRIKWQDVLASMRKHQELHWLTTQVQLKYGL